MAILGVLEGSCTIGWLGGEAEGHRLEESAFRHGWNETMIRQLYATLEVHTKHEKSIWMMGTHRFKATYRDLVAAVRLDYRKMMRGKLIVELPCCWRVRCLSFTIKRIPSLVQRVV